MTLVLLSLNLIRKSHTHSGYSILENHHNCDEKRGRNEGYYNIADLGVGDPQAYERPTKTRRKGIQSEE